MPSEDTPLQSGVLGPDIQSPEEQPKGRAIASGEARPSRTEKSSDSFLYSECRLLLQHTREIVDRTESHMKWTVGSCIAVVSIIVAVMAIFGAANYWALASQVSDLKDRVAKLEARPYLELKDGALSPKIPPSSE